MLDIADLVVRDVEVVTDVAVGDADVRDRLRVQLQAAVEAHVHAIAAYVSEVGALLEVAGEPAPALVVEMHDALQASEKLFRGGLPALDDATRAIVAELRGLVRSAADVLARPEVVTAAPAHQLEPEAWWVAEQRRKLPEPPAAAEAVAFHPSSDRPANGKQSPATGGDQLPRCCGKVMEHIAATIDHDVWRDPRCGKVTFSERVCAQCGCPPPTLTRSACGLCGYPSAASVAATVKAGGEVPRIDETWRARLAGAVAARLTRRAAERRAADERYFAAGLLRLVADLDTREG